MNIDLIQLLLLLFYNISTSIRKKIKGRIDANYMVKIKVL